MRTKISLFLIAVLCSLNGVAQKAFNKHFEKKSLRIDFALSGNSAFQAAAIQQLRQEPVWGGPVKNLTDRFNYGGYYVNLYDKASGELIYSRGFNTLFEEWRSTEQAKNETQAWTNSVSVPYPKRTVVMEISARDKADMQFRPLLRTDIDPTSIFIDRGKSPGSNTKATRAKKSTWYSWPKATRQRNRKNSLPMPESSQNPCLTPRPTQAGGKISTSGPSA